jgi:hypothetical protein
MFFFVFFFLHVFLLFSLELIQVPKPNLTFCLFGFFLFFLLFFLFQYRQNTTSFWSTTGLYPHELFVGFREELRIVEIKIVSSESMIFYKIINYLQSPLLFSETK